MVKIKVYIEGGVMPGDTIDTQTADNSNQFREAFSMLFEALGISSTAIEIVPAAGKNNAFKRFITDGGYLLTDLDRIKNKESWLNDMLGQDSMKNISINDDQKTKVFFMIQAMEAWILSQPNKIEEWAKQKGFIRVRPEEQLSSDNNLKEHPEKIIHPEDKLNTILKGYFRTKDGEKLKYRGKKLKFAPSMIQMLDAEELVMCFSEVKMLQASLKADCLQIDR